MNLPISGLGSRILDSITPATDDRKPIDPKARTADTQVTPPPADWTTQISQDRAEVDPEGPDPRMWALLTHEERAFFMGSAARGPATYAPTTEPPPEQGHGNRLGARIDLRV